MSTLSICLGTTSAIPRSDLADSSSHLLQAARLHISSASASADRLAGLPPKVHRDS